MGEFGPTNPSELANNTAGDGGTTIREFYVRTNGNTTTGVKAGMLITRPSTVVGLRTSVATTGGGGGSTTVALNRDAVEISGSPTSIAAGGAANSGAQVGLDEDVEPNERLEINVSAVPGGATSTNLIVTALIADRFPPASD